MLLALSLHFSQAVKTPWLVLVLILEHLVCMKQNCWLNCSSLCGVWFGFFKVFIFLVAFCHYLQIKSFMCLTEFLEVRWSALEMGLFYVLTWTSVIFWLRSWTIHSKPEQSWPVSWCDQFKLVVETLWEAAREVQSVNAQLSALWCACVSGFIRSPPHSDHFCCSETLPERALSFLCCGL